MQKKNFWSRLGYVLLGLAIGALSGFCSTIQLEREEALLRPPVVYWGFCVIVWIITLRPDFMSIFKLFLAFMAAHLIAAFGGQCFTGYMAIGTTLTFMFTCHVLKVESWRYFVGTTIFLSITGLLIDLNLDSFFTMIEEKENYHQFQPGNQLALGFKVVIFAWQTLTMGAMALQLYVEKIERLHQRVRGKHEKPIVEGESDPE